MIHISPLISERFAADGFSGAGGCQNRPHERPLSFDPISRSSRMKAGSSATGIALWLSASGISGRDGSCSRWPASRAGLSPMRRPLVLGKVENFVDAHPDFF